jgi:hypothetical protein
MRFFDERQYSEKTAKAIDEEARAIADEAYERTLNLLREKRSDLEAVAHMLLEKETITHDDIVDLIGPRPFQGDPAYAEFIARRKKDKIEHGEIAEPDEDVNPSSKASDQELNRAWLSLSFVGKMNNDAILFLWLQCRWFFLNVRSVQRSDE